MYIKVMLGPFKDSLPRDTVGKWWYTILYTPDAFCDSQITVSKQKCLVTNIQYHENHSYKTEIVRFVAYWQFLQDKTYPIWHPYEQHLLTMISLVYGHVFELTNTFHPSVSAFGLSNNNGDGECRS